MTSSSVPPVTSSSDSGAPPQAAAVACGALLVAAHDPIHAAHSLVDYVRSRDGSARRALEQVGIAPRSVDDFRALFPSDAAELEASASCGAYWALGHRARPERAHRWFPVMSGTDLDPDAFDRRVVNRELARWLLSRD